jgi:diguanylate cyclase (GGDEF)-like protein
MQPPIKSTTKPLRSSDTQAVIASFVGRVSLFSASVDCIYFLFFLAIGSPFLAWMNVVSVTMYLAAYHLVQRRQLHFAVVLIWLEAFSHAAIGTMMLGWESGFHYLLLMFIPSVAMTASRRRLHVFLIALLAFLVTLDIVSRMWGPMAPIPQASLIALKWLNISLFVLMFSALASYYRQKITQAEQRLKVLAGVDVLTGLNNRRHFESVAEQHMADRRRSIISSVVVVGDIDLFKSINDTFGHEGGDRVLVAVSRLLKKGLREVDSLARWGGEEFVFLMHETGLAEAIAATERIRRAVEDSSVSHQAGEIRCTMSFGVTQLLPNDTLGDAIARADHALYRSKAQGRNRVSVD